MPAAKSVLLAKCKCPRRLFEVVRVAAANVGNVNAKAELVLAAGVDGEVCSVKVIFGAARIGLCAAGCEQSRTPRAEDHRRRCSRRCHSGRTETSTG